PVATHDGWRLNVWVRRAATKRFREPVVLCHGLGNTHAFFEFIAPQNFAAFLTGLGFDTYTVDVRGTRGTVPPHWPADATFDDIVSHDVPAVLKVVCDDAKVEQVLWVGHSLGGLIGLAAAPSTPQVKAVCTVGSPVFFQLHPRTRWLLRAGQWLSPAGLFPLDWLALAAAPMAGRFDVPWANASINPRNVTGATQRFLLANAIAPMWRGVLRQLEDWVTHDAFRSLDRSVDYRAGAAGLAIPVLVVAGTVDGLAPEAASRKYFDALTTTDKQLLVFGASAGHEQDYGHGDLVIGERAHLEVYPAVGEWLSARASPLVTHAEK
ncbi:MAG: alpha/beta fold hydrolase, partial [Archangium sp.]|nr:alpha/beta fold hydrolase [Archangium sp.]